MKRYACWFYIYQHKHPICDYFCLHLQPPFDSHSYTRSHHFTFIYFLFPLLFKVLEQCGYFNVNSDYADMSLNPPLSFRTAFPQNPWGKKNKIRETCICLWSLSATQYLLSRLVKGNTFFLMGHTNSPFPAVCESCIPIWYYIYDA